MRLTTGPSTLCVGISSFPSIVDRLSFTLTPVTPKSSRTFLRNKDSVTGVVEEHIYHNFVVCIVFVVQKHWKNHAIGKIFMTVGVVKR
jgi:hypothetical protein